MISVAKAATVGAACAAGWLILIVSRTSAAQPLPALPPPPTAPSTAAPTPTPTAAPTETPAPPPPSEGPFVPPPPPPVVYVEPQPLEHAPRYSLWLGGRVGLLAYSGGLYVNDPYLGTIETTGNFVRPGVGLEVDVGARLARRYIPYFGLELGVMGAGHR